MEPDAKLVDLSRRLGGLHSPDLLSQRVLMDGMLVLASSAGSGVIAVDTGPVNLRECFLTEEKLLVVRQESATRLALTEIPLNDGNAFIFDTLGMQNAEDPAGAKKGAAGGPPPWSFELHYRLPGKSADVALTWAATDKATKAIWLHHLAGVCAEHLPHEKKVETGWFHRYCLRGTIYSAAVEDDTETMRSLVRFAPSARARGVSDVAFNESRFPELDLDAPAEDDGEGGLTSMTALHLCAKCGNIQTMNILLESGASPYVQDADFNTPLQAAIEEGTDTSLGCASALVMNDAPLDGRNILDLTALQMAMSKLLASTGPALPSSFVSTIQLLLARGACPRDVDGEGFEPLHRLLTHVTVAANPEVGLLLIGDLCKAGADPNAPLKAADPASLLSPVDKQRAAESGEKLGREWGQASKSAVPAPVPSAPTVAAHGRPVDEVVGPLHLAAGIAAAFSWASENVRSGPRATGDIPVAEKAGSAAEVPSAVMPVFPSATIAGALLSAGRKIVSEAVIGALLAQGSQPNARTIPTGETALHLLLRLFAALKSTTAPGLDAALVADQMAQIQGAVRRLVAGGARFDIGDQTGMTALQLADSLGLRGLLPGAGGGDGASGASSAAAAGSPKGAIPPRAAEFVPGLCRSFKRYLLHEASTLGPRNRLEALSATFPARIGYVVESGRWHGNNLTDDSGNNCLICDSGFTMLKRKHHCRHCGVLVCQACSNKKFPLFKPPASAKGADSDDDDATAASFGLRRMGMSSNASPDAAAAANVVEERTCDGCFNRLCTAVLTSQRTADEWQREKDKAAAMGGGRNFGAGVAAAAVIQPSPVYGAGMASSSSAGEQAQRDALFGGRSAAAGAGADATSGSSRRLGGASGGASEVKETLQQAQQKLAERGEKINRLEDKTRRMAESAQGFAEVAEKLKRQSQPGGSVGASLSKWFGL